MMMMMMMIMIRRRDRGTKFIIRNMEKEIRLTVQQYENDEDDNPGQRWRDQIHHDDQGKANKFNHSGI